MHAHISEMPIGTYKKRSSSQRRRSTVMTVASSCSLFWWDDAQDFKRLDWKHGVVFPPPESNGTST